MVGLIHSLVTDFPPIEVYGQDSGITNLLFLAMWMHITSNYPDATSRALVGGIL